MPRRIPFIFLLIISALLACCTPAGPAVEIEAADRNPWTHLDFNDGAETFHFAVVGDRTALPRPGVFERAVAQLNRLQPAFVMSIGDLAEGYTFEGRITDRAYLEADWNHLTRTVAELEMPFFYVMGNNDVNSPEVAPLREERLGRTYYYSFVYRQALFLVLNSDDPPGGGAGIGEAQVRWLERTLARHADARWTFVFLHRPFWEEDDPGPWIRVEALLHGRPRTVFAGHKHRYRRTLVDGYAYYTLATTGGVSDLEGIDQGQFDHITWVAMTPGGPRISTLMLDGLWGDDPALEQATREERP